MKLWEWYQSWKNKEKNDLLIADAGFCPNCWGQQEYDGKFVQAVEDQQIRINNHDAQAQRAFVMDFVKTHLEPIRLKNHEVYDQCPVCKIKYSKT